MKKIFFCLTTFLFLLSYQISIYAQCSDAGVCQLGHLNNNAEEKYFNLSLSYKNGYSGKESDVTFHSFQLNTMYELFEGSTLKLSTPYNLQSRPSGDVNGIGDLLLSWTQELFKNKSSLNTTIGIKLATGNENKEPKLSQVYQPGLGSNDFIFTIDYNYENFGIGAGYQLAGGRNDKEGIRLKRGDDLILRANYFFSIDDFQITPQFIFIKRLSKSSILDINSSDENFIEVKGSDQSQLNFLLLIEYNLNDSYALFSEAAIPFTKREINIDGLKRAYTFSLGFKISY